MMMPPLRFNRFTSKSSIGHLCNVDRPLAIAESILTKETAVELAEYVQAAGVSAYVFRGETDKPHRHRTWPNAVLRKHRAEGISPRTFRRTLARNWGDDLKSLMSHRDGPTRRRS